MVQCAARVTVDNDTMKVIRIEGKDDLDSQVSYHKQWSIAKDTTTALIYKAGAGQEELKRRNVRDALQATAGRSLGSCTSVAAWLRVSLKEPP